MTEPSSSDSEAELEAFLHDVLHGTVWREKQVVQAYVLDVGAAQRDFPGQWRDKLDQLRAFFRDNPPETGAAWIIAEYPDGHHERIDPWRPEDPRP
jgi:hypothetical protein